MILPAARPPTADCRPGAWVTGYLIVPNWYKIAENGYLISMFLGGGWYKLEKNSAFISIFRVSIDIKALFYEVLYQRLSSFGFQNWYRTADLGLLISIRYWIHWYKTASFRALISICSSLWSGNLFGARLSLFFDKLPAYFRQSILYIQNKKGAGSLVWDSSFSE